jgi:hypothetical protein
VLMVDQEAGTVTSEPLPVPVIEVLRDRYRR